MIDEKLIVVDSKAKTDKEVLDELSELLFKEGYVKESFKKAVKDREKDFPTGLAIEDGFGIAIPHADREHVNKIGMACATLNKPVKFRHMGGTEEDIVDVSLVCMLAIDDSQKHMETLAKLMELFSDHEKLEKIKSCETKAEVRNLLSLD